MSSSRKVVIVGASGYVGKATLPGLVAALGGSSVVVATRNPESSTADELKSTGASVVRGSFEDVESLKAAFEGADTVYLITPGAENRTELTLNGVAAARATASKPAIVVVSIPTVDESSTVLGGQFGPIEAGVKASGLAYTILRLPMFTDNNWGNVDTIKGMGKLFGPADPHAKFTTATLSDIGAASTAVLTNPGAFAGRTLNITGPAYSHAELAAAFTRSLGKPVEYVQVSLEAAEKGFASKGYADWQVKGGLELYRFVDAGTYVYENDFEAVTGKKATRIEEWVESVKAGFQ